MTRCLSALVALVLAGTFPSAFVTIAADDVPQPTEKEAAAHDAKPAAASDTGSAETPDSLRQKLLGRAEVVADKVPLNTWIAELSKSHDIPLRIDETALKAAGIAVDFPITANIRKGTLNTILKRVLSEVNLKAVVRETEVLITSADADVPPLDAKRDENREKKRAVARAAARAKPAVNRQLEQQIDQQAQQYVRQFVSLEKAELYFLREVCEIPRETLEKLKAGTEDRAKSAARQYASTQFGMMNPGGEAARYIDPRRALQESLAEALKERATPDEIARYEAQMARRQAARKSVSIRNLVSKLDRELVLSDEQRTKLVEVMHENWDESWGRSIQLFIYGEQYYPPIPDALVQPLLTPPQKAVWRGLSKNHQNIFFSGLGMLGNEIEDFPWDEEQPQNGLPVDKGADAKLEQRAVEGEKQ